MSSNAPHERPGEPAEGAAAAQVQARHHRSGTASGDGRRCVLQGRHCAEDGLQRGHREVGQQDRRILGLPQQPALHHEPCVVCAQAELRLNSSRAESAGR